MGFEAQIQRLSPWFHNVHLPDGTSTCPDHALGDFPATKWQSLSAHLPLDLSGARVLDVGCNAGYYSLELARRGAMVRAIDVEPHYLTQATWLADVWGLSDKIEFEERQVYSLASVAERWDIVLFLGVLYHLRYPLLGLDIVSRCVGSVLVVQSLMLPERRMVEMPADLELSDREPLQAPGWPVLSFIERRFADDPTNWWVPNRACLHAMLRSTGMRVVAEPADEFCLCVPDRASESSMWTWNESEFLAVVGR